MNRRALIHQPEAVSALATKLPMSRVVGGGKLVRLFVPNIKRDLYKRILKAIRIAAEQEQARMETAISRTIH